MSDPLVVDVRHNGYVIAVVLDTNAIHRDPWLKSDGADSLAKLAAAGACELVLPDVVIRELTRQQRESANEGRDDAMRLVERVERGGAPMERVAAKLRDAIQALGPAIEENFRALLERPGIVRLPVPSDLTEQLIARDLDRRRPFLDVGSKDQSAGFRDAVIWESLLGLLSTDEGYAQVVFVTADRGFLDKEGQTLHPDLVQDLDQIKVDCERVRTAKNSWDATKQVRALLEATVAAQEDARVSSAATDALLALVGESISMQMVYGGDYDFPSFVQFDVPPLDESTITHIEQLSAFDLRREEETITATAEVAVSLDGFLAKSAWFMDEDEGVEVVSDWNDHYVLAQDELTATAIVELDARGSGVVVLDVRLTDRSTDQPESSTGLE